MMNPSTRPGARAWLRPLQRSALAATAFALALGTSAQVLLSEDFTGATSSFTVNQLVGTATWTFNNPGARDITGASFDADFAIFDSDDAGNSADSSAAELVSPPFDASSGLIMLSFSHHFRQCCNAAASVQVWDGTAWTSVLDLGESDDMGDEENPAQVINLNITEAAGGSAAAQVKFVYGGDWDYWWALDNIEVEQMDCLFPADLAVNGVTTSDATLSWTDNGSTGYQWAVTNGDVPDGSNEAATGDGSNMEVTGLASGITYTAFVRSDCGDGSFSGWSTGVPFVTSISNDECSGALPLTVNPDLGCGTTTQATVTGATASGLDSDCSGTADDDVWFSFTATATSHNITIGNITGSTSDMYMALWEGDCGNLVQVPNSCSDPESKVVDGLSIGTTYSLQVYTYTSTPGQTSSFTVCVGTLPPPPANDECSGATALTVNPDYNCTVTTPGTVASATASNVASTCSGSADDDVWFSFTATDTLHRIQLTNITGSVSDMYMALWEGDCGNLVQVPNGCSDPQTMNIGGLSIGTQYFLQVYTYTSNPGQTSAFDVCVGTEPFCQPPTAISLESLDAPDATVTWLDNGSMEYQWELRVSGDAGSGTDGLANSGTATSTTLSFDDLLPDSLYVLYVRSICSAGDTSAWSAGLDILDGYCQSIDFGSSVEPICNVTFAGIDNDSPSDVDDAPAVEDFTAIHALVARGGSYTISATGNTAGDFTTYINAFFDWDQDNVFETMVELGSIYGSTCDEEISATVDVPADAAIGTTRMRVVKNFNSSPEDACNDYGYGQAEDYSVDVTFGTAVQETAASGMLLMPNPAHDRIALRNTDGKAAQAEVYDLVGNLVLKVAGVDAINVAGLAPGTYILKAQDSNGRSLAHLRFVKL